MADLDDLNRNLQLGNLGQLAGMAQRRQIMQQQEEIASHLREQQREQNRLKKLPNCPDCKSPVEEKSKVCAKCGLRIITVNFSSLSQRWLAFPIEKIAESISDTVAQLQKEQVRCSEQLRHNATLLRKLLQRYLKVLNSNKTLKRELESHGDEIYEHWRMSRRGVWSVWSDENSHVNRVSVLWCGCVLGFWALGFWVTSVAGVPVGWFVGFFWATPFLVAIALRFYFDPLGIKKRRRIIARIDKELRNTSANENTFYGVAEELTRVFRRLRTSIADVSQVGNDWRSCEQLATENGFGIEAFRQDATYVLLKNIQSDLPRPSVWPQGFAEIIESLNTALNEKELVGQLASGADNQSIVGEKPLPKKFSSDDAPVAQDIGEYEPILEDHLEAEPVIEDDVLEVEPILEFWLKRGDKLRGPVSRKVVVNALEKGQLAATDLIATHKNGPWVALSEGVREYGFN